MYGKELILDLEDCDPTTFTRESIERYVVQLCELIGAERGDLHFWDYEGEPEEYAAAPDHLKGISAIQFIMTSNITIHTLDVLKTAYINVFSCDNFSGSSASKFTKDWFRGSLRAKLAIMRG